MVIAVIAMRMMQVAIDQVVHVVAVRYCLMPAARAMDMSRGMAAAVVVRRALIWVPGADFQSVLVNVAGMWVVQVTVMQEIHVTVVPDRGMAATDTVPVVMVLMVRQVTGTHMCPPCLAPLPDVCRAGAHGPAVMVGQPSPLCALQIEADDP